MNQKIRENWKKNQKKECKLILLIEFHKAKKDGLLYRGAQEQKHTVTKLNN